MDEDSRLKIPDPDAVNVSNETGGNDSGSSLQQEWRDETCNQQGVVDGGNSDEWAQLAFKRSGRNRDSDHIGIFSKTRSRMIANGGTLRHGLASVTVSMTAARHTPASS